MSKIEEGKGLSGKLLRFVILAVGILFNAIGAGVFILPNHFLCGGATGFGRFISNFTGMPVSYSVAIVSVTLFLIGLICLGWKFAATIVMGTFLYPAALFLTEQVPFLQNVTEDKLLAAAFGALFIGIGVGMVIRIGASTGGSDVLAIVLNRKAGLNTAMVLNAVDLISLLLQCTFAAPDDVLYGILIIMAYTVIANKVLIMGSNDAQFLVVSKKWKEIGKELSDNKITGYTILHGETGYTESQQEVLMCTVHRRMVQKVKKLILNIDPVAFTTVVPASDVSGRGFSLDRNYGFDEEM